MLLRARTGPRRRPRRRRPGPARTPRPPGAAPSAVCITADRVRERLQVALQRAGVGRRDEPLARAPRGRWRAARGRSRRPARRWWPGRSPPSRWSCSSALGALDDLVVGAMCDHGQTLVGSARHDRRRSAAPALPGLPRAAAPRAGTGRCAAPRAQLRHRPAGLRRPARRPRRRTPATRAEMVAARAAFLAAGHYDVHRPRALSPRPADGGVPRRRPGLVVDVGAGTGYYLARVLDALPDARRSGPGRVQAGAAPGRPGPPAGRRGAAPTSGGGCRSPTAPPTCCSTSSPRATAPEFPRVLRPDGALLVVTPTAGPPGRAGRRARPARGRPGQGGAAGRRACGRQFTAGAPATLRRRELALTATEARRRWSAWARAPGTPTRPRSTDRPPRMPEPVAVTPAVRLDSTGGLGGEVDLFPAGRLVVVRAREDHRPLQRPPPLPDRVARRPAPGSRAAGAPPPGTPSPGSSRGRAAPRRRPGRAARPGSAPATARRSRPPAGAASAPSAARRRRGRVELLAQPEHPGQREERVVVQHERAVVAPPPITNCHSGGVTRSTRCESSSQLIAACGGMPKQRARTTCRIAARASISAVGRSSTVVARLPHQRERRPAAAAGRAGAARRGWPRGPPRVGGGTVTAFCSLDVDDPPGQRG